MMPNNLPPELNTGIEKARETFTTYKAWLATYVTKALVEDIQLMMGKQVKLRNLINRRTLFSKNSEWYVDRSLSPEMNHESVIANHQEGLSPAEYQPMLIGQAPHRALFVNGVLTPMAVAMHQQQQLSDLLPFPVSLIYNPTRHVIADLLECHLDRNGLASTIMQFTKDCILNALAESDESVLLVGYSQGAIIISAALQALQEELDETDLKRIHYVTFGAGVKQSTLSPLMLQEHFVNEHDPIPHLGLLHPDYDVTGEVYLREAHGHLLVADYLNPLAAGDFAGGSQFEKRLMNTNNNHNK